MNHPSIAIIRFAVFCACMFCALGTQAHVLTVCKGCALSDPAVAVRQAHAGDTILVKAGTYEVQSLTLTKPLVLLASGKVVLDAREKDEALVVASNHVVIDGFVICNTKRGSMRDYAGIRVFKSNYVLIQNNTLLHTFFGIHVSDSRFVQVLNNKLTGGEASDVLSGNGIHMWQSSNCTISGNHIEQHRDGIYFEFARYCKITRNVSENNFRYGLHFMFSDNDTYIGNTFRNNGTGVAVMYTKGIHMMQNVFEQNWGASAYGLLLKDISNSYIFNNTFRNNTIGIYLEGSSRIHISCNVFSNNGWATRLLANCVQDTFRLNTFQGNTFDVSTNGTEYQNFFTRNYWDKYAGYDMDRDGLGDVPYRPVSLYSVIMEQMPYAVMLLRSFAVDLLDKAEKNIPSLTPEQVKDDLPLMYIYR